MNRKTILLCLLLPGALCTAQAQPAYVGSLEQAKIESRQTKRPVFINCHARWAAPCKAMDSLVLTDPALSHWIDKHFVSLHLDMQSPEGEEVARTYGVRSYAHFLVVDHRGELLQRISGGARAPEFQQRLALSLSERTSLRGTQARYQSGHCTTGQLRAYLQALQVAGEDSLLRRLTPELLARLEEKDYAKPENWQLLRRERRRSSPLAQYVLRHQPLFVRSVGENEVSNYVQALFAADVLRLATTTATPAQAATIPALRAEMQQAGLSPDGSLVGTVLRVADCRARHNLPALLQCLRQSQTILQAQQGLLPLLELSLAPEKLWTPLSTMDRHLLSDYLLQAALREEGTATARRLRKLAQSVSAKDAG